MHRKGLVACIPSCHELDDVMQQQRQSPMMRCACQLSRRGCGTLAKHTHTRCVAAGRGAACCTPTHLPMCCVRHLRLLAQAFGDKEHEPRMSVVGTRPAPGNVCECCCEQCRSHQPIEGFVTNCVRFWSGTPRRGTSTNLAVASVRTQVPQYQSPIAVSATPAAGAGGSGGSGA